MDRWARTEVAARAMAQPRKWISMSAIVILDLIRGCMEIGFGDRLQENVLFFSSRVKKGQLFHLCESLAIVLCWFVLKPPSRSLGSGFMIETRWSTVKPIPSSTLRCL